MDADSVSSELEDLLFDPIKWLELPSCVKSVLKTHHVAIILFLLSSIQAQVLYWVSQSSSSAQAEAVKQQNSTILKELQKYNQETTFKKQEPNDQLKLVVEQLSVLYQTLSTSAKQNMSSSDFTVERRMAKYNALILTHPKRGAAVSAQIPASEFVYVFKYQRKWLYIGYSDIVVVAPFSTGHLARKETTHVETTSSDRRPSTSEA